MLENKYFLMRQKNPDVWYILERDEASAWHNGIPSIMNTDCVYAAETLPDMLHQIQEAKDSRFYVELDWINDKKETRSQKYQYQMGIHVLIGYSPEVCDFETNGHPYLENWVVNYVSSLWYRACERMTKVRYFTEKMEAAVKDYIEEQGLVFDEE